MGRLTAAKNVRARGLAMKGREIPIDHVIDTRDVLDKSRDHATYVSIALARHEYRPPSKGEQLAAAALARVDRQMAWKNAEKSVEHQRLEHLARLDAAIERDTMQHPAITSHQGQSGTTTKEKKQNTPKQKAEKAAKSQATRDENARVKEEKVRDLRIKRLQNKLIAEGWNERGAWSEAYDVVIKKMDTEKQERFTKTWKKAGKQPSRVEIE